MSFRRRASRTDDDGGLPACRAVVRWAWRLFRREWRQQALVLALLTLAVAAAVGFSAAAYNVAPVPGNAEFGSANHFVTFAEPDPEIRRTQLAAARQWFGSIDVIGHRSVPVPGSVETLDYRVQDPDGPYGSQMLDLRRGRYPATDGEIAVTNWVAETFVLDLGAVFALDGVSRTIVGLVENPSDLDEEFALVSPSSIESSESVTVLVDASEDRLMSFRAPGYTNRVISSRGDVAEDVLAALSVLVVSTGALFLVSLVAAASFIVVAQRRQRQLGMLAAVGATERHLRLVMLANGTAVGVVAAVLGAVIGVAGWIAVAPRMENSFGYRIDAINIPWWLIATGMVLAVVAATGAAWWPARTVASIPAVQALSGRPPRPASVHRSGALAASFIVVGLLCLGLAGDVADETVNWTNALLVAGGALATVIGVLLVSPLAVHALARCAKWLPVSARLAVRDLGRYQARAGAALAAISLVLGIPVAIVVAGGAASHGATAGNLTDRQLLVRDTSTEGPFVPQLDELPRVQAGVDKIAGALANSTVVPLDAALDPATKAEPGIEGRPAVSLVRRAGDGWRDVTLLYLVSPELLDYYGIDLAEAKPVNGILTRETGELRIFGAALPPGAARSEAEPITNPGSLRPTHSSLPGSFVTLESLRTRGWERVPSGRWLVETSQPLSTEELNAAREIAADAGLTVESRDHQRGLETLQSAATAAGVLLALAILGMTVGLIRNESAGDLRTLTAAGATRRTRRNLTAATVGALALLGVALGMVGAYAALIAGYGDLGDLSPIPIVHLAVIAIGTPLAAAGAGWLVAGREPGAIARVPMA